MLANGQCHCGAIRYEADLNPKRVVICHCEDCQTFSGGPYRTSVLVPAEQFRLLKGAPREYRKTAESGTTRTLHFCDQCGTHVWGSAPGDASPASAAAPAYSVRVGTLKQRAELPPVAQVWCRSSLPWVDQLSGLHKIETQ